MLFLKLWFRKLIGSKVYSVANILGLTLGFTAFILISLFIRYELNWDKSHENYDSIYRIQRHLIKNIYAVNGNNISPHTRPATAQLIEGVFPEFEKISVIREIGDGFLFTDKEHYVSDNKGIHADSCFFDIFTYQFIAGNKETALDEPYSIVLSELMAENLFGSESALNKTVLLDKKYPLTVTGIYQNLPYNTSLRPNYIVSFSTLKPLQNITRNDIWTGDCMTYALLAPGSDAKLAQSKIRDIFSVNEKLNDEKLQLCPLSKVYLNFNDRSDYLIVLRLFALIGIFILAMSGFNYINLSLAKASMRGKEVAIKKVSGTRHESLILEFLGDTVAISLLALLLAFAVSAILLPVYSNVVDKHLEMNILTDWKFFLIMVLVAVATGILSGLYPALFFASQKITNLFKGDFFTRKREFFSLKKVLVASQFAISLFLIVLTMSFSMQIKYITQKNLGFEKDGLLYAQISASENEVLFDQMRDRILQHPEIKNVSMSRNLPFVRYGGGTTNWEGNDPETKINCRFNSISYDYLSVLEAKVLMGRNFSPDFPGDAGTACIINESAAKCFGWDDPIGKHISDNKLRIVGVVSNFVYQDMHNPIDPAVLVLAPNNVKGNWIFSFRTDNNDQQKARDIITTELRNTFPNDPFEIRDVSSAFNNENGFKIYHSVNKTLYFFTFMNVLLAVVGMFGLVSFSVSRRTKEIGVRKINGSSIFQIFNLLNSEYYVLMIYAVIVAFPFAWLVYSKIPSANKLPVQPWVLVISSVILLVIVLLSTSYQTIKAALQNPVEALRYE